MLAWRNLAILDVLSCLISDLWFLIWIESAAFVFAFKNSLYPVNVKLFKLCRFLKKMRWGSEVAFTLLGSLTDKKVFRKIGTWEQGSKQFDCEWLLYIKQFEQFDCLPDFPSNYNCDLCLWASQSQLGQKAPSPQPIPISYQSPFKVLMAQETDSSSKMSCQKILNSSEKTIYLDKRLRSIRQAAAAGCLPWASSGLSRISTISIASLTVYSFQ